MGRLILAFGIAFACVAGTSPGSQGNPFIGRWNITATAAGVSYPYWLEVHEEGGKLIGDFQDRTGAVRRLPEITLEGDELVFSLGPPRNPDAPKPVHRARVENGKLKGELTTGSDRVPWVGVPAPNWGNRSANAAHRLGDPHALQRSVTSPAGDYSSPTRPSGWVVADGTMTNAADREQHHLRSARSATSGS
jgi:hypothetical protein